MGKYRRFSSGKLSGWEEYIRHEHAHHASYEKSLNRSERGWFRGNAEKIKFLPECSRCRIGHRRKVEDDFVVVKYCVCKI